MEVGVGLERVADLGVLGDESGERELAVHEGLGVRGKGLGVRG